VIAGLVLAAGAGTRMGVPKALVEDESGPWLSRAVQALTDGGCDDVTVVLGAAADQAAALVPGTATVVASDWADGMSASLRLGLTSLTDRDTQTDAVLLTLVDLPDVGADVVRRLLDRAVGPTTLARAYYDGRPGHPVLIGRDHLTGVIASAQGDRGARDYFAAHPHQLVECGDLATGRDVDAPE
jgi:molybdenum cofactor cytidylyltransferase/nicotine blue oxidoreductase